MENYRLALTYHCCWNCQHCSNDKKTCKKYDKGINGHYVCNAFANDLYLI